MDDPLEEWSRETDLDGTYCDCAEITSLVATQWIRTRPTVLPDCTVYCEAFVAMCGECGRIIARELHTDSFERPPARSDVVWEVR